MNIFIYFDWTLRIKHEMLSQHWFNVEPPSATLAHFFLTLTAWGSKLKMTSKGDPRTEVVKMIIMAVDP